EFYSHFDAFKNRKVLFCDSRKTGYFEQGPLQPQVQLADLIHAFHPELLPDYKPVYYKLIP
ncbi:MAG: iron ABC transporter substrate-binding protein, partial [Bacteroidetes bacterium CG_4_9_14_3_um_filter_41_19]